MGKVERKYDWKGTGYRLAVSEFVNWWFLASRLLSRKSIAASRDFIFGTYFTNEISAAKGFAGKGFTMEPEELEN